MGTARIAASLEVPTVPPISTIRKGLGKEDCLFGTVPSVTGIFFLVAHCNHEPNTVLFFLEI